MKELSVTRLDAAVVAAADIPALMDEAGVEFQKIDSLNWPDWPYRPEAAFRIAHTGDAILLHYVVSEEAVRAVAPEDNGRVWEDSCVEFFVSPADDGIYYNVECNCAGQLLIGGGEGRNGRSHAPRQILDGVDRWASLGRAPFDTRAGQQTWQVALRVPVSAFFMHAASPTAAPCAPTFTSAATFCPVLISCRGTPLVCRAPISTVPRSSARCVFCDGAESSSQL